ncbi:MAG TPA: uroporphyrinogen decarboxylase family protein [Opitutaceae bacterium]|nr:uroporphyrinogen decarboxylase family protein [Opitutaceae bacterium]HND60045.1 uroporphyrinogen decarboxylase family protein [Opitutaceae bacterium]
MTSIERVRRTLRGEPVDHLPAQPMAMMYSARHAGIPFIDYTKDGRKMAEAQLKLVEDFGLDCLLTCSDPAREVIDIAGEGSVDWFVDQGPAINEERAALADKLRLRVFKVPDPLGGGRMHDRVKSIELMRRRAGPGMSIVGWIEGPLALAAELRGLNTIMLDFVDDPAFAHDLLAYTADVAIAYAPAQIAAGADTIGMSDAAAGLIGPVLYEQFLWPQQKRVLETLRRNHPDVLLRQHMCGRIDKLYPKMAELPVDIYEIDFPANLELARQKLGPTRTLAGNVSTITDLLEGSPERVYEACRRCHEISGKYFIVGAGCEISPLTPPDNLRAMIAYARDHQP